MSTNLAEHVALQYDDFQTTLEGVGKEKKYLNYGYTRGRGESYELKQEQLCREVFKAAEIEADDVVVDVGFGSGEQDFLLAGLRPFRRLIGFNIAGKQVEYAARRAAEAGLAERMSFHHSPAEDMSVLEDASVDKVMAIECAFYFDRPRFYAEAARVLKPGGRLVLADISFSALLAPVKSSEASLRRVGTIGGNRAAWEEHLRTVSIRGINRHTRQGCQMTVFKILGTMRSMPRTPERRTWLKMAISSQLVVLGLLTHLLRYDMIVLEKP